MEKEEFGLVSKCSNQAVKFLPSQFLEIGILEDRKDVGRMFAVCPAAGACAAF